MTYVFGKLAAEPAGTAERWISVGNKDVTSVVEHSWTGDLPGGATTLKQYKNEFSGVASTLTKDDQNALGAFLGSYGLNGVKQAGVTFAFDAEGRQIGIVSMDWATGKISAAFINGVLYGFHGNADVKLDAKAIMNTVGRTASKNINVDGKLAADKEVEIKGFKSTDANFKLLNKDEQTAVGNFVAGYQLGIQGLAMAGQTALYLGDKYVGVASMDWKTGKIAAASIEGVLYGWSGKTQTFVALDAKAISNTTGKTTAVDVSVGKRRVTDKATLITGFKSTEAAFARLTKDEQTAVGNFVAGYQLGAKGLLMAGQMALFMSGKYVGMGALDANGKCIYAVINGVGYLWSESAETMKANGGKAAYVTGDPKQVFNGKRREGVLAQAVADAKTFPKTEADNYKTDGEYVAGKGNFAGASYAELQDFGNFLVSYGLGNENLKRAGPTTLYLGDKAVGPGVVDEDGKCQRAVINGVGYLWAETMKGYVTKRDLDQITNKPETRGNLSRAVIDPKTSEQQANKYVTNGEYVFGGGFEGASASELKAFGDFLVDYGLGNPDLKRAGLTRLFLNSEEVGIGKVDAYGVCTESVINGLGYLWAADLNGGKGGYTTGDPRAIFNKEVQKGDLKRSPEGAQRYETTGDYDFSKAGFAGASAEELREFGNFVAGYGMGNRDLKMAGITTLYMDKKAVGIGEVDKLGNLLCGKINGKIYGWSSLHKEYVTDDANKIANLMKTEGKISGAAKIADRWDTTGAYDFTQNAFANLNAEERTLLGNFVASFGLGNADLKVAGLTTFYLNDKAVWTGQLALKDKMTYTLQTAEVLAADKESLAKSGAQIGTFEGKKVELPTGQISGELRGSGTDSDLKIFLNVSKVIGAVNGDPAMLGNILFFQTTVPDLMFQRDQVYSSEALLLVNTVKGSVLGAWAVGTNNAFGTVAPGDVETANKGTIFKEYFFGDNIKTAADFSDKVLVEQRKETPEVAFAEQAINRGRAGAGEIRTPGQVTDTSKPDNQQVRLYLKDGQIVGRSNGDTAALGSWYYLKTATTEYQRVFPDQYGGKLDVSKFAIFKITDVASGTVSIRGYNAEKGDLTRSTVDGDDYLNNALAYRGLGGKEDVTAKDLPSAGCIRLRLEVSAAAQGKAQAGRGAETIDLIFTPSGNLVLEVGNNQAVYHFADGAFYTQVRNQIGGLIGDCKISAAGEFVRGWQKDLGEIKVGATCKWMNMDNRYFIVDTVGKKLTAFDGGELVEYRFTDTYALGPALVVTRNADNLEMDVTYKIGDLSTPVRYEIFQSAYAGFSRTLVAARGAESMANETWDITLPNYSNYTASVSFDAKGRIAEFRESSKIFANWFGREGLSSTQTQTFTYNRSGNLTNFSTAKAGYMQDAMQWYNGLSGWTKFGVGAAAVVVIGVSCFATGGAAASVWAAIGASVATQIFAGAAILFAAGAITAGVAYAAGARTFATSMFYAASAVGIGGALISIAITTLPQFGSYATWVYGQGVLGHGIYMATATTVDALTFGTLGGVGIINATGVVLAAGTGASIFLGGLMSGKFVAAVVPASWQRKIAAVAANSWNRVASSFPVRFVSYAINKIGVIRFAVDAATSIMLIPVNIFISGFKAGAGGNNTASGIILGALTSAGQFMMFISMGGQSMWSWASNGVKNGAKAAGTEFVAGLKTFGRGCQTFASNVMNGELAAVELLTGPIKMVVGLGRVVIGTPVKFIVAFLPAGVGISLGVTANSLKAFGTGYLETLTKEGFVAAAKFAAQQMGAGLRVILSAAQIGKNDLLGQAKAAFQNAGQFFSVLVKTLKAGGGVQGEFLATARSVFQISGAAGLIIGTPLYFVGNALKSDWASNVGKWMMVGGAVCVIAAWIASTALRFRAEKAAAKEAVEAAGSGTTRTFLGLAEKTSLRVSAYAGPMLTTGILAIVVSRQLSEGPLKKMLFWVGVAGTAVGALMFLPLVRFTLFNDGFKAGLEKTFSLKGDLLKFDILGRAGQLSSRTAQEGTLFYRFMIDDAIHAGFFAKTYNFVLGTLSHSVSAGFGWAQFDMYIRLMKGENIFSWAFWTGDKSKGDEGVLGVFEMGARLGPILSVFGNVGAQKVDSILGSIFRDFLGGPSSWVRSSAARSGIESGFEEFGLLKLAEGTQKETLQKLLQGSGFFGHLLNPLVSPLQFFSGAWAVTRLVPVLSQYIFTPALQGARMVGLIHMTDAEIQGVAQDLLFIFLPQRLTAGQMLDKVREELPANEKGQSLLSNEKAVEEVLTKNFDNEIIEQKLGVRLTMTGNIRNYNEAVSRLRFLDAYNLLANGGLTAEQLTEVGVLIQGSKSSDKMAEVLKMAGVMLEGNARLTELGKYSADATMSSVLKQRLFEVGRDDILAAISGPNKNGANDETAGSRVAEALGFDLTRPGLTDAQKGFFSNFVEYVIAQRFALSSLHMIAEAAAEGNGTIELRGLGKVNIAIHRAAIAQAFGEIACVYILAVTATHLANRESGIVGLQTVLAEVVAKMEGEKIGQPARPGLEGELKEAASLLLDMAKTHGADILLLLVNVVTMKESSPNAKLDSFSSRTMAGVLDVTKAGWKIKNALQWAAQEAGAEKLNIEKAEKLDSKYVNTTGDWLTGIFKKQVFSPLAERCVDAKTYLEIVKKFFETGGVAAFQMVGDFISKNDVIADGKPLEGGKTTNEVYAKYFGTTSDLFKNFTGRNKILAELGAERSAVQEKLLALDKKPAGDEAAISDRNKLANDLEALDAKYIDLTFQADTAAFRAMAKGEGLEKLKTYIEAGFGKEIMEMRNAFISDFTGNSQAFAEFKTALEASSAEVRKLIETSGKNATPAEKATMREGLKRVIDAQEALKKAFDEKNVKIDETLRNYVFLSTMFEIAVDFVRRDSAAIKWEIKEASRQVAEGNLDSNRLADYVIANYSIPDGQIQTIRDLAKEKAAARDSSLGDSMEQLLTTISATLKTTTLDAKSGFILGDGGQSFEDRPFADLYGRGNSAFLMAIGLQMGFDVSAGTGIGKTRAGLLAASFYSANNTDRAGIFIENADAVAKYFKLEAESQSSTGSPLIYEQLAACLGIRIINGNDYVAEGKQDYRGLLKALEVAGNNGVLMMDIITKTHLGNAINADGGMELLRYIGKLGLKIVDEVQIPAFSLIEAIVADGSRAEYAKDGTVINGVTICAKLSEMYGKTLKKVEYSEYYDKYANETSATQSEAVFTIASDGQVFFNKAALKLLATTFGGAGFQRNADYGSIVRVLFGAKELAAETIINGLVIHKPSNGFTLEEQQQSSDVALQIAVFYKFLVENASKKLSDIQRLTDRAAGWIGEANANTTPDGKGTGILTGDAKTGWKVRDDLAVNEVNGVTIENGRVTKIELELVKKWYDVEGIGQLRTRMGTPVQSCFVKGVVGLSATLPAAMHLLTGNVRLELGQSMADLQYMKSQGRLRFSGRTAQQPACRNG